MNAYEAHAEAKKIADLIEREGLNEPAMDLRSAVAQGVSGTEIFMKLRWFLAPLRSADLKPETSERIRRLHDYLDQALQA